MAITSTSYPPAASMPSQITDAWDTIIGVTKNLALATGEELLKLYDIGADAKAADKIANNMLVGGLHAAFPNDYIVSEEGKIPTQMPYGSRWWLVDPVDGSKYFALQCPGWSIMIALVCAGRPIFGLVYEPLSQRLWMGVVGLGAWEEGDDTSLFTSKSTNTRQLRITVKPGGDKSSWLYRLCSTLKPQSITPLGSVGLRACAVACDEADLQIHPQAGLTTWDTAAGEAIVLAAGGFCRDMRGRQLRYDRPLERHRSGVLFARTLEHIRMMV